MSGGLSTGTGLNSNTSTSQRVRHFLDCNSGYSTPEAYSHSGRGFSNMKVSTNVRVSQ